jgi:transposase-like protein
VDTAQQFCPNATCAYQGWGGLGNLRANGHPSGGPWRQFYCTACEGYFQETHGTPFHGKRVAPDLLVWAVGALAEGLGIRAVARVFEVDPNTVLQWLGEAADHLKAFSQYVLPN